MPPPQYRRSQSTSAFDSYVRKLNQVSLVPDQQRILVVVRQGSAGWKLSISRGVSVLVLSDSVLRPLPALPVGWEVRIHPGAVIRDAARLLATVTPEQCAMISQIIVYMGINNRGDEKPAIRDQVRDVVGQAIRLGKRLMFNLIPVSDRMTSKFQEKITAVNEAIQQESRDACIPAIPSLLVRPMSHRTNDIHYDGDTAQWIIRAMALQVKQNEDFVSGRAMAWM